MNKTQYIQIAALSLIVLGSFSFVSTAILNQKNTGQMAQVVSALDSDPALTFRWPGPQTFNGTTDYVMTSGDSIGTGPVTVTAWITPRSWGGSNAGRIVDNDQF